MFFKGRHSIPPEAEEFSPPAFMDVPSQSHLDNGSFSHFLARLESRKRG
jgi:hypothetical protein